LRIVIARNNVIETLSLGNRINFFENTRHHCRMSVPSELDRWFSVFYHEHARNVGACLYTNLSV